MGALQMAIKLEKWDNLGNILTNNIMTCIRPQVVLVSTGTGLERATNY